MTTQKALVVYESMFGNTEQVARAVGDGLAEHLDVEVLEVGQAPAPILDLLDLVVVGGPTHAFSMSRPGTREDARRQGATQGDAAIGIREWLTRLHAGPHSELVATFDTRVEKVRHLPGSAARAAGKVVKRLDYTPAVKAESFYVVDVDGPLVLGEVARARSWGEQLGAEVLRRAHQPIV
ncbi:MAG TPA: hypothetical protein VFG63_08560 [Nocardioidaceae bacterium]|nr:hypothetical protein [Nocardioidaceae bacterium]